MLKIAHIRKTAEENVRELAKIFINNDTRRQEKKVEALKQLKPKSKTSKHEITS